MPYSRLLYFNDTGRERGITADLVRDVECYINESLVALNDCLNAAGKPVLDVQEAQKKARESVKQGG